MNEDLKDYLVVAMNDWQDLLKEVEASEDTENIKQELLREIRETRSRLERTGETQR